MPAGAQAASHLLEASLHDQSAQEIRHELVEELLGPEQALDRPALSDSRFEVHAHAFSHFWWSAGRPFLPFLSAKLYWACQGWVT
jgi:hypothetical protein